MGNASDLHGAADAGSGLVGGGGVHHHPLGVIRRFRHLRGILGDDPRLVILHIPEFPQEGVVVSVAVVNGGEPAGDLRSGQAQPVENGGALVVGGVGDGHDVARVLGFVDGVNEEAVPRLMDQRFVAGEGFGGVDAALLAHQHAVHVPVVDVAAVAASLEGVPADGVAVFVQVVDIDGDELTRLVGDAQLAAVLYVGLQLLENVVVVGQLRQPRGGIAAKHGADKAVVGQIGGVGRHLDGVFFVQRVHIAGGRAAADLAVDTAHIGGEDHRRVVLRSGLAAAVGGVQLHEEVDALQHVVLPQTRQGGHAVVVGVVELQLVPCQLGVGQDDLAGLRLPSGEVDAAVAVGDVGKGAGDGAAGHPADHMRAVSGHRVAACAHDVGNGGGRVQPGGCGPVDGVGHGQGRAGGLDKGSVAVDGDGAAAGVGCARLVAPVAAGQGQLVALQHLLCGGAAVQMAEGDGDVFHCVEGHGAGQGHLRAGFPHRAVIAPPALPAVGNVPQGVGCVRAQVLVAGVFHAVHVVDHGAGVGSCVYRGGTRDGDCGDGIAVAVLPVIAVQSGQRIAKAGFHVVEAAAADGGGVVQRQGIEINGGVGIAGTGGEQRVACAAAIAEGEIAAGGSGGAGEARCAAGGVVAQVVAALQIVSGKRRLYHGGIGADRVGF